MNNYTRPLDTYAMLLKRISAGILLAFALAGLVMFMVREIRGRADLKGDTLKNVNRGKEVTENDIKHGSTSDMTKSVPQENLSKRVIMYYLYGNMRCITCKTMETFTEEVVKVDFAKELADGKLVFLTDNYERPGNEKFINEYGILSASVFLMEEKDGKVLLWKNLDQIWNLNGDKIKFQEYIRTETSAFLKESETEKSKEAALAPAPEKAESAAEFSYGAFFIGIATAFGLGLLTSISPCPLATNIAAISFLGKRVSIPRQVLFSGLLYSLGRVVAYVVLGTILVAGLLATPGLAAFLSKYINSLMGPILIIAGIFLLELITLNFSGGVDAEKLQKRAEKGGLLFSVILGMLFALAFCPSSAALFFGGLIPLSIKLKSSIILPTIYGLATGLPVVVFAIIIALSSNSIGKWFNRLSQMEVWIRRIAGVLFVLVGVYYSLIYIFGVHLS